MKTLGTLFIIIAVFCAFGGFFHTKFAGNMLTPSYETLLGQTVKLEKQQLEDNDRVRGFLDAEAKLDAARSGEPTDATPFDDSDEKEKADKDSAELDAVRSERQTKMAWFFIAAAVFGTTGSICRVAGNKSNAHNQSATGDTKACPMCGETIKHAAILCRFCGKDLSQPANTDQSTESSRQFFILHNDEQAGPYSTTQIRELLENKHASPLDLAWYEGLEEWTPLYKLPEFSEPSSPFVPPPTQSISLSGSGEEVTEEDIRLFVRRRWLLVRYNQNYYAYAWVKHPVLSGQIWARIWVNFGPSLLGPFWFAYRKMYLYAALFFAFDLVAGFISAVISAVTGGNVNFIHLNGILLSNGNLILLLIANLLYLHHAEKRILNIKREFKEREIQKAKIARAGGTNILAALLSIPAFILFFVVATSYHGSEEVKGDSNPIPPIAAQTTPAQDGTVPLVDTQSTLSPATAQETPTEDPEITRLQQAGLENVSSLQTIPGRLIGPLIALGAQASTGEIKDYGDGTQVGAINTNNIELSGKQYPIASVYSGEKEGDTIVELNNDNMQFITDESEQIRSKGWRFTLLIVTGTTGKTTTIAIK